MATLVLSTVGALLGGPVGGAIGSLVGQSIDQQLFGSPRRGPRLGDLSVQTSSYGTQLPRIYGTMRVAGSIVWATDLVESSQTSGAKGQPDTTFSYSVSFAVALSSRPLLEIRRIWADGKLLRGEDGDFKVSTEFRFHDGRETQEPDPLIASIEGADHTPAYRGLALAVFENLELADYGNRIPFLTFEVVADAAPLALSPVFGDASGGLIDCDAATAIGGYAAMGATIRAAIEPLVESFAVDLVEDGAKLRSPPAAAPLAVAENDLGCSYDGRAGARIEREQAPARSLPASLTLTFYDPERDYQTGQARSEAFGEAPIEARVELPAVLSAPEARSLAEQAMARRWALKDRLTVRLPPHFAILEPGALVELQTWPERWQVERLTIDGMVVVAELRPLWSAQGSLAADSGRFVPPSDVVIGDLALALVELPDLAGDARLSPTVTLAASTTATTWKRLPVEVSSDQFFVGVRTARRKAIMGFAATPLGAGALDGIDLVNSVEVELVDPAQWLTSCEDEALPAGANLALIGDELFQFADAAVLGPGRFLLTRLVRGRYATGWAVNSHASGDLFLLIDPAALQSIPVPISLRGAVVTASCRLTESIVSTELLVDGRSVRTGLFIDGEQVVGRRAEAIAEPSGGANVDLEARAAVSQILESLRQHGLIDP